MYPAPSAVLSAQAVVRREEIDAAIARYLKALGDLGLSRCVLISWSDDWRSSTVRLVPRLDAVERVAHEQWTLELLGEWLRSALAPEVKLDLRILSVEDAQSLAEREGASDGLLEVVHY